MAKIAGRMYVVVYGSRAIGNYAFSKKAMLRLKGVKRSSRTRRCIFKVYNGRVMKKPYKGGNRYFRKKSDVRNMWKIAVDYVKTL